MGLLIRRAMVAAWTAVLALTVSVLILVVRVNAKMPMEQCILPVPHAV
jgi:hypothetical protein